MKKYLFGLLVGFVGLISFSNAGSFTYTGHFEGTRVADRVLFSLPIPLNNTAFPTYFRTTVDCNFSNIVGTNSLNVKVYEAYYSYSSFTFQNNQIYSQEIVSNNLLQLKGSNFTQNIIGLYFKNVDAISSTISFDYTCVFNGNEVISLSCPECPECETCPEVNTGDILSGSCDTNYCVENDLCPVPSNFSQLFINDIEFPSKSLINVFIPDYIYWDYSSTDTGFDLYVGSGYDQNYIDSVLKINSYRPDSSDFTNIFVSGLTLLFPYLIFALFLVFMWKLIKRIFKH